MQNTKLTWCSTVPVFFHLFMAKIGHVTRSANYVSSSTFSRNIKHRSEKLLKTFWRKEVLSFIVLFFAYATTFRTIEDSSAAVYEKEQNYTAFKSPAFLFSPPSCFKAHSIFAVLLQWTLSLSLSLSLSLYIYMEC